MNMQAMMKQAQQLQKDMMKAKEEIDKTDFVGESSIVKVTIDGTKTVKQIEINKDDTLDVEDIEMLEDMLMVAINDAMKQVDDMTDQKMGKFGNGMSGLF